MVRSALTHGRGSHCWRRRPIAEFTCSQPGGQCCFCDHEAVFEELDGELAAVPGVAVDVGVVEPLGAQILLQRVALSAVTEISGLSAGVFAEPVVGVDFDASSFGPDARFLGFSFAQFAMPVWAARTEPFHWNPAANVSSPPAVIPLVVQTPRESWLLAPLDQWHEQIIGVVQSETGLKRFRWGWHGDLDQVPAGFTTTLAVLRGPSVGGLLDTWGALAATVPDRHGDDPLLTHLSYWTDNGAAYWYRTEPGLDMAATLEQKVSELDELGIPIGTVELDSWFYEHEVSRPVTEMGALDDVPPTGMLQWKPRPDVVPEGVEGLRDRLGGRPLALHSRHIAASSPLVEPAEEWWVDLTAHPIDQAWFVRWFDDARRWGATCIEQDWMIMSWFGVRQLRSIPDRAMNWLRSLNDLAAERDMALVFCMATPGDLMAAGSLDRVVAVRTCDDYRYADDPARLWRWYLTVNRLARSLGLPAFKDCFFTGSEPGESGLDGDPHREVESVLAALSGGPVGIGDRFGCTDLSIVERLLDADGHIATSDVPVALVDGSLVATTTEAVSFADAWSGDVRYVLALHLGDSRDQASGHLDLGEPHVVYDWRSAAAVEASTLRVDLAHRDWALYVCAPVRSGAVDLGDPTRYAMAAAGARRRSLRWHDGRLELVESTNG